MASETENNESTKTTDKPAIESMTVKVGLVSPIIAWLLTIGANAVGIPIPPGVLDAATAVITGVAINSAVMIWARIRKGGGGKISGVFKVPGQ